MQEAEMSLATKAAIKNALDLGGKNNNNNKKTEKLQTFDSSYFTGKSNFEGYGLQDYLIFQPVFKYFKMSVNSSTIVTWKFSCFVFTHTIKLTTET